MTKVLVTDDDRDIRELVTFTLEQRGYEVSVAADGVDALEAIGTSQPDLLILDLMMPRLSGLELCHQLRAKGAEHDFPIVMLTARGQESDVARGFAVGADDYIIKPFSPRELHTRVEAALRRGRR